MGTIADKLAYLNDTKAGQLALLQEYGSDATNKTTFREYEDKFRELLGGGGGDAVTGTLTITLVGAPAGAMWSPDGTAWYKSGATATLPVGDYTVTFSEVDGYTRPADIAVTVGDDTSQTIEATYTSTANPEYYYTCDVYALDLATEGATPVLVEENGNRGDYRWTFQSGARQCPTGIRAIGKGSQTLGITDEGQLAAELSGPMLWSVLDEDTGWTHIAADYLYGYGIKNGYLYYINAADRSIIRINDEAGWDYLTECNNPNTAYYSVVCRARFNGNLYTVSSGGSLNAVSISGKCGAANNPAGLPDISLEESTGTYTYSVRYDNGEIVSNLPESISQHLTGSLDGIQCDLRWASGIRSTHIQYEFVYELTSRGTLTAWVNSRSQVVYAVGNRSIYYTDTQPGVESVIDVHVHDVAMDGIAWTDWDLDMSNGVVYLFVRKEG